MMNPSSSKSTQNIEDVVTCNLCSGMLRNPKFLHCLHSFCEHCLLNIQTRLTNVSRSEYKITCPTCESITYKNGGVANLKDDVKSNQIMAYLEEEANKESQCVNQNPKPNCSVCGEEALHSCPECELLLCSPCKKEHADDSEGEGSHPTMSLQLEPMCDKHPNRLKIEYCSQCQISLCRVCLHKHDKNHSKVPIVKYFEYNASLRSQCDVLQATATKFSENIGIYEKVAGIQDEMLEDTKNFLAKATDVMVNKVNREIEEAFESIDFISGGSEITLPSSLKVASESIDKLYDDMKRCLEGTVDENMRSYADLMKKSTEIKDLSLKVDDLPTPENAREILAPKIRSIVVGCVENIRKILDGITADSIVEQLGLTAKRSSIESG